MANLRTNNLCGERGRNAYNGSVFFGSRYTFLQLDGSSDFAFGTGDFTIEAWIKIEDDTNTNAIYDSRPSGSNGAQIALFYSGSSNAILFAHGGTVRITGTIDVGADHAWHHIALTRSSGSTKLFVDGVQDGSTYSDSTSYENPANRPLIGQSGGSTNLDSTTFFKGYISNLRVCAGHAVYSSNFTPPTSKLGVHYNSDGDETVLLCCHNSDDPTAEATGKTIVANGLTSFVNRTDNLINNGNWDVSASAEWTLSGGTAAISTGQSGTFGDGNHVLLTASSSFAYLIQAFTTVVGRTYRVNVQSNGGDASFISTTTDEDDAVITDIRNSGGNSTVGNKTFVATQTTYYMILRGNTGGANFDTASVYEQENRTPPKVLPPFGVDAGNTFDGAISMNSSSWMYFPTGRTEERGRGRGIWGGGNTPSNTATMDYLHLASGGKAINFGDVTVSRNELRACGSSTRGVWAGGRDPSVTDVMDFVEIATQGNATDFGNLTVARAAVAAVSNSTRGVFMAGFTPSNSNHIDYITIASIGNATDFGDMLGNYQAQARAMSPTRGLASGNYGASNLIEYITIATTGNSTDFGDRTIAVYSATGTSDNTRGVFAGGDGPTTNIIDFVTIATTGNATDFGDMTSAKGSSLAATSDSIIGCIGGGPSADDTIEKITIQTTGNAVNFGDLFEGRNQVGATSDSHGGLS